MPPPKVDGGADDDGGEGAMAEEKDLVEKELAVSYMKMKMVAYQDQSADLQVKNHKLTEELAEQKAVLKDVEGFYASELKGRARSYTALQTELDEARKELEALRASSQKEAQALIEQHEAEAAELSARVEACERKAMRAEEYLGRREEFVATMQQLKDTLAATRKSHEDQIAELERQHVQDRDKWKKTMHTRIQETKQFMMKLTDNQLEMTTKRTIMENEQMGAEMAYQSRQTNAALAQNKVLEARVHELRRALSLSRDTENELAKRSTVYQDTIRQLLERLQAYDGHERAKAALVVGKDEAIAELQREARVARLSLVAQASELDGLRRQLVEQAVAADELRGSIRGAGDFLLACLADISAAQLAGGPGGPDAAPPGDLADVNWDQRQRTLTYLLEQLQVTSGCVPILPETVTPPSTSPALPPIAPRPSAAVRCNIAAQDAGVQPARLVVGGGLRHSARNVVVSTATQTADPDLVSADKLLTMVMADVRQWGCKRAEYPQVLKAKRAAGATVERVASRRSTASTPPRSRGVASADGLRLGTDRSGSARQPSPGSLQTHFKPPSPAMPGSYRQIAAS